MGDEIKFVTHGDPFSDPPRANVCTKCGALVGREDEDTHREWHKEIAETANRAKAAHTRAVRAARQGR